MNQHALIDILWIISEPTVAAIMMWLSDLPIVMTQSKYIWWKHISFKFYNAREVSRRTVRTKPATWGPRAKLYDWLCMGVVAVRCFPHKLSSREMLPSHNGSKWLEKTDLNNAKLHLIPRIPVSGFKNFRSSYVTSKPSHRNSVCDLPQTVSTLTWRSLRHAFDLGRWEVTFVFIYLTSSTIILFTIMSLLYVFILSILQTLLISLSPRPKLHVVAFNVGELASLARTRIQVRLPLPCQYKNWYDLI